METLSTYQNPTFLYSCILGIILGIYYDIFKIFRIATPFTQKQLFFCDLFFMSTSAISTFIFLLALNSGRIRVHLLAGELIGFIVYRLTLSRLIILFAKYIINTVKRVLRSIKRKLVLPLFSSILKVFKFIYSKFSSIFNVRLKPLFKPLKNITLKHTKHKTNSPQRKNNKRKFVKPLKP